MSRKLKKVAVRLQHETLARVQVVAKLLREYREGLQNGDSEAPAQRLRRQHAIDRAVAEYLELQRQLRRVRRKGKRAA